MTRHVSGDSQSQRISAAVNELLDASGRERAAHSVGHTVTEQDTGFVLEGMPAWLVPAAPDSEPQPLPWTSGGEPPGRTGMLRTYTAERVTGAEPLSDVLGGLRFSHKDNIGIRGFPITAGNPALDDRRSAVTSPLLSAVEAAGGALVGANHMAEFAMSPTGHSQWLGDGVNPRNDAYFAGGSSSGSAIAVARGTCDVSFGTDTGGSVRLPAAFCGLFGYKPTNGLFSHTGLLPLSESLDTIGLISRECTHLQTTVAVLVDDDAVVDPASRGRLRDRDGGVGAALAHLSLDAVARTADEPVRRGYEQALHALGRADTPGIDIDRADLERRSVLVVSVEAARNVGRVLNWDWNLLGDQVLSRVIRGTAVPAVEYADAVTERSAALRGFLDDGFGESRFLLMPTAPVLAPRITPVDDQADPSVRRDYMRASEFTRFINYLGLPAVTIPLPEETDALAPSLQLVGRPFDDLALLDAAQRITEQFRD